jgi:predicted nucleic acid-binding protein
VTEWDEPDRLIADSSAWIEMLRQRESPADLALSQALNDPSVDVMVPEPVQAEVLIGARTVNDFQALRRLFATLPTVLIHARTDFDLAVDLYRLCRSSGRIVRSLHDCLIVAMAQRIDAPVLHHDRDFVPLLDIAGVAVAPGSLGA